MLNTNISGIVAYNNGDPSQDLVGVENGTASGILIGYPNVPNFGYNQSAIYNNGNVCNNASPISSALLPQGVYFNSNTESIYPYSGIIYATLENRTDNLILYSCSSGIGGGYGFNINTKLNTGSASGGTGGFLYKIVIGLNLNIKGPLTLSILVNIYNNGYGGAASTNGNCETLNANIPNPNTITIGVGRPYYQISYPITITIPDTNFMSYTTSNNAYETGTNQSFCENSQSETGFLYSSSNSYFYCNVYVLNSQTSSIGGGEGNNGEYMYGGTGYTLTIGSITFQCCAGGSSGYPNYDGNTIGFYSNGYGGNGGGNGGYGNNGNFPGCGGGGGGMIGNNAPGVDNYGYATNGGNPYPGFCYAYISKNSN